MLMVLSQVWVSTERAYQWHQIPLQGGSDIPIASFLKLQSLAVDGRDGEWELDDGRDLLEQFGKQKNQANC
jgi:hypothetical protein